MKVINTNLPSQLKATAFENEGEIICLVNKTIGMPIAEIKRIVDIVKKEAKFLLSNGVLDKRLYFNVEDNK